MSGGARPPNLYSIPAGVPFVDALAAKLLAEAEGAPDRLADHLILLPTRRAVRSLREAFLRLGCGRPLLLPRMQPLGDLDEDALAIAGWEELPGAAGGGLPPAISGLQRQMLLTSAVQRFEGMNASPEQAARLAAELARLLDAVQTERLDFADLGGLVKSEELSEHWQRTLRFLRILTDSWPAILAEEGALDPAERRNRLLERQAALWRAEPPAHPVIAAGSTGTVPATADLLAVVAGLPAGCVVLPGLDRDMDDDVLSALDEVHPQFNMVQLLAKLGASPADVKPWEAPAGIVATHPARARLINDVLLPAAVTHRWRALETPPEEALTPVEEQVKIGSETVRTLGVSRVDCPGPDEEARVIALFLRQAVGRDGKTAALVTPDRRLARRVAAELLRWNIVVDDSAGDPLDTSMPATFLRLLADAAAENFAPVRLLALLKHPLAAGGMDPPRFRALARRLESGKTSLRGPRPAPGLGTLVRMFEADAPALSKWLAGIEKILAPLIALFEKPHAAPGELLAAHVAVAEALAASDKEAGSARLWAGDAGEALAGFVAELAPALTALAPMAPRSYPALLEALLEGRVVRRNWGAHPRLFIWGLLEARLQHADLMILGGLNEGTWPPEAAADPWMSRPMRKQFGLPLPERRIGLTAHDFTQAFSAPEVVLTRAIRVDGTPTVPARWLTRLENFLKGKEIGEALIHENPWVHWQSLLDQPAEMEDVRPPAPRPPVEARPRALSVTQVETWMRDPYGVYARHVLELKALPPLDEAPSAAEYGTRIHEALRAFVTAYPKALPPDAEGKLLDMGRAAFGGALAKPGVWAFWWPRFERIAKWFAAGEAARRADVEAIATEVSGTLTLSGPAGPFRLSAKADRIDRLRDGSLRIVDYKTGTVPTQKDVAAGFSPQLPLEALIARAGKFESVPEGDIAALHYWRLGGGAPAGEVRPVNRDPAELLKTAEELINALVRDYDREDTPYLSRPRPDKAPPYSDYEHLARVKEWASADESGGTAEDEE